MELLSFISGADSLKKLMIIIGVFFIVGGTIYPFQQKNKLNIEKYSLISSQKKDSIDLIFLAKNVNAYVNKKQKNTLKINKFVDERDSLKKNNYNGKFTQLINQIQNNINEINDSELIIEKEFEHKYKEFLKKNEVQKIIKKRISNNQINIDNYFYYQLIFISSGIILFLFGVCWWYKSQKIYDEVSNVNLRIQKEELKKIQKENE